MDIAFLKALSSIELPYEPFCVLKMNTQICAFTNLIKSFTDISNVPVDEFVTGFQNYDSNSGLWCAWNEIKKFDSNEPLVPSQAFEEMETTLKWSSNIAKQDYIKNCELMIEDMKQGDYFLANLTRKINAEVEMNPIALAINSALYHDCEFRFFYHSSEFSYLSLSPERFILIKDKMILSQPIKGTAKTFEELAHNIKDREENTMIVDLVRADFSKIVEPASIQVSNMQEISAHPGLVQMSSSITAELPNDFDIRACVKELMPIASVTGTPKPRVLVKIAEYENFDREIYCGAIGWVDTKNNECDLSVAIRGIKFVNNVATIGIGAGITHKSNPESEYNETELKAYRLIQLIEKTKATLPKRVFTSTKIDKDGNIFAYEKHIERLFNSCEKLNIPIDIIAIDKEVKKHVANEEKRMKIAIDIDGKLMVTATANEVAFEKFTKVGIALDSPMVIQAEIIKSEPRYSYDQLLVQGRLLASDNIDDVLIVENGYVKESTMCNIFVRFGREIVTPSLKNNILDGILRQIILEQFDLKGFSLTEAEINVEDLSMADEIILTNSIRGACPIDTIDSILFETPNSFKSKEKVAANYFDELFRINASE